jgi:hypothetical protein
MLRFQWNALRRGDHVLVHDVDDPKLALRAGVVDLIDTRRSGRDVAIRYTTGTRAPRPVRPGRFAVHFDPIDDDGDDCWRCNENRPSTSGTGRDRGSSLTVGSMKMAGPSTL